MYTSQSDGHTPLLAEPPRSDCEPFPFCLSFGHVALGRIQELNGVKPRKQSSALVYASDSLDLVANMTMYALHACCGEG